MSWRSEARTALRLYPKLKRRQGENEMQITPVYGGAAVQHSASRTTEDVALRSPLTDRELNIISAVELELYEQSKYYNADARLKMIQLLYFSDKRMPLEAVAEKCDYSVEALKRWNTEVLKAVSAAINIQSIKKVYLDLP